MSPMARVSRVVCGLCAPPRLIERVVAVVIARRHWNRPTSSTAIATPSILSRPLHDEVPRHPAAVMPFKVSAPMVPIVPRAGESALAATVAMVARPTQIAEQRPPGLALRRPIPADGMGRPGQLLKPCDSQHWHGLGGPSARNGRRQGEAHARRPAPRSGRHRAAAPETLSPTMR